MRGRPAHAHARPNRTAYDQRARFLLNPSRPRHRGAIAARYRDVDILVSAVNRSYNTHSGVPRRARPTGRWSLTMAITRSAHRISHLAMVRLN